MEGGMIEYTMLSESEPAIIIDIGSFTIKAGFSGDDTPRVICPTIYGYPIDPSLLIGMDQKDYYTGKEAIEKKQLLRISHPVQNGAIVNFPEL